ncbi:MAG TPA: superoxide dismutase family protein [Gemmatimonadaceae bacterium]|nr:superoxide dismutase family protein [Gemmatimonadaceae bacterium]
MIFHRRYLVLSAVLVVAVVAACATVASRGSAVAQAGAIMYDINGSPIGTAQLWQDPSGVVNVEIASLTLPAGTHGIHFHSVGKCEGGATAFATAGAHYNPLGKEHGLENPNGPHAGDAPNIVTPASGVGKASFTTNRVSLTPGTISLFDADGSAIVVHASADDQRTQPSGNSGARIACGVVRAIP